MFFINKVIWNFILISRNCYKINFLIFYDFFNVFLIEVLKIMCFKLLYIDIYEIYCCKYWLVFC